MLFWGFLVGFGKKKGLGRAVVVACVEVDLWRCGFGFTHWEIYLRTIILFFSYNKQKKKRKKEKKEGVDDVTLKLEVYIFGNFLSSILYSWEKSSLIYTKKFSYLGIFWS